ncbi:Ig-like domain-containing protein [Robertkochia flava]|uniref:Ig-like domain-containing protein n=1 Tax=Robertkochia flava TaxID=3447986 RepID=UPI001CCDCC88|nr:Ig-like domain-containing protein [Robertkochia marina]
MTKKQPFLTVILVAFLLLSACSKSDPVPDPLENDSTPPTVELAIAGLPPTSTTDPANPPVVSREITVQVDAKDANGIQMIEAFIDNNKVGEDTTAPFSITIDLSNYQSKGIKLNKTQTLYTLKVTATDNAGNQNSNELDIIVDNEVPVISDVSLSPDTIINGSDNEVTFNVEENQELSEVKAELNGNLLEVLADSTAYAFNLDTAILEDGPNTVVISATDKANNIAFHHLNFISDNTGPVIISQELEAGQVFDSPINFSAQATDEYSNVTQLGLVVASDTLLMSTSGMLGSLGIDPENYPPGELTFQLFAKDTLGNVSELEIPVEVKRLLITISTPENLLGDLYDNYWAFASDSTGATVALTQLKNSGTFKLHADSEFGKNQTFMLTFLEVKGYQSQKNQAVTYHDMSRNKIQQIRLNNKMEPLTSSHVSTEISMSGFPANLNRIYTEGKYHTGGQANETTFVVNQKNTNNQDSLMIVSEEYPTQNLKYKTLAINDLENSTLNYNDFSNEMVVKKNIDFGGVTGEGGLYLYGYASLNDKENDNYHKIYQNTLSTDAFSGLDEYYLIDKFPYYRYLLSKGAFIIEAYEKPKTQYTLPAWSLDWTQTGNTLSINSTGQEHTTGKLYAWAASAPYSDFADWVMIFDSSKAGDLVFPEIPNLIDCQLKTFLLSNTMSVEHVELNQYPQATSYEKYLQDIIREGNNAVKFYGGRTGIFRVKDGIEGPLGSFLTDYFYPIQ